MKILLILPLYLSALGISGKAYSDESNKTKEIEDAQIIINQSATPTKANGTIIILPCNTCESITLPFDKDTEFYLNGNSIDAQELGQKIDWRGTIIFSSQNPKRVIEVILIQPERRK